jgi:hypothetical protein
MPLNPATLASGLSSVFAGSSDVAAAGSAWAGAYRDYAAVAMAGVAAPIFTGLEEGVLAGALAAAFTAGVASLGTTTLTDMELAFQAFWMVPPVVFGAGAVTAAPPGLAAALAAVFATGALAPTSAVVAAAVAAAIDTWTRMITVQLPGPVLVLLT